MLFLKGDEWDRCDKTGIEKGEGTTKRTFLILFLWYVCNECFF